MINYMLTYPGSLGTITVPIYDNFTASTFPTIEMFFGLAGLQKGINWDYNITRKELTVQTGGGQPPSRAFVRTTEHPEHLPGSGLAWFWMDEVHDSPLKSWLALQPALRQPGYPHTAWITSTPAGRRHWAVKIFDPANYVYMEGEEPLEHVLGTYKSYTVSTLENPFGGRETYEQMVGNYGGPNTLMAREQLFGEDVLMEGLVFTTWNPTYHAKSAELWPITKQQRLPKLVIAGMDFGFEDPFAIVVVGYDSETGSQYVLEEFSKNKMSEDDMVMVAKTMQDKWNIQYIFADSASPGIIHHLSRRGVRNIRKALKQVDLGLGVCTAAVNNTALDGSQGFYVNPKCKNFIQQIESFTYDNTSGKSSRRKNLHHFDTMAAWRYAEMGLTKLVGTGSRRVPIMLDLRM